MAAIAAQALAKISDFGQPLSAPMLLWALWKAGPSDVGAKLFAQWSDDCRLLQAEPFGLLLLDSDWWKDVAWELELLVRLHRVLPVRSLRLSMVKLGFDPGLSPATAQPGLQKLGLLVDEVECAVQPGHASSILRACEVFAGHRGQWLKVAGQEKAEVLERGLQGRAPRAWELALEFGAFVGYTACRMGRAVQVAYHRGYEDGSILFEDSRLQGCNRITTMEIDPIHACIARHVIDVSRLSHIVEVWIGQVKDLIPRLGEEYGNISINMVFMDQRGTTFHDDLSQLEELRLMFPRCRLVADNTVKPGAPVYCWHTTVSECYSTTNYTLHEFLESSIEDWQVVCDYEGPLAGSMGERRPLPWEEPECKDWFPGF